MKQLFRYATVLIMLFISLSASAQSTIKVITTSHGTVTADKNSASRGNVVKITVTPSNGYYFMKEDLRIAKTIDPSLARTRGEIPVADDIVIYGSDPTDLSISRTYQFTVPDDGYEFQVSATFNARTAITTDMVTLSSTNYTFNGSNQKPTVRVSGLTEGTDYVVSFVETSWSEVGTYSVNISGKSKYKGIITKKFTITPPDGSKVSLNKSKASIEKGKTMILTPTVYPSSLSDKSVTWKSSDTSIATVTSSGKVKGIKPGTATITCTSIATGAKATCKVTVGYVSLNKTETIIKKGKTVTLTPTVYPTTLSDKSVTWESSDETIATVTTDGKVKGIKYGTATITCTSNATGLSTTCKVTVGNVTLSKSAVTIRKGKSITLTAKVYPSTLTDKSVKWESSNTKYATVSSDGKVTGVKVGTATITCTSVATGLSTTCKVTIGAVTLDKKVAAIKKGKTVTLTPTVYPSSLEDKSVTWKSSDETIATVSTTGKVKGIKYGTATITCTSNATGLSATCKMTVGNVTLDKYEAIIKKGKTLTLTAKVYPTTLTDKSVKWESSNTKIATVTSDGQVKGIKVGTATITCTSVATGLSRTCEVTIGAITLDQKQVAIKKGKTVTLTPTVYPSSLEDKSVTWNSSDETVATVSTSGKVKGLKYGTATITCTSNATGLSATCKVTVGYVKLDQTAVTINKGKTVTLISKVYPTTLTDKSVIWESSNTNIATVSDAGIVKGLRTGTVTITCTSVATGLTATCTVTVTTTSDTRSMEGDDDEVTGIENLEDNSTEIGPFDVYDMSGRKVAHQVTSLDGLSKGVYIVNGKKVLKK